jgi:cell division protein FtsL
MYNNRQTSILENVSADEKRNEIKSNLDRILNYEKYMGTENATNAVKDDAVETETKSTIAQLNTKYAPAVETEEKVYNEEDITPSSTTMQFGQGEDEDIYEDVNVKRAEKTEKGFKLSSKGKVLLAVYALVIITILSLIILNSRMLRSLDASIDRYNTQLKDLNTRYETVINEYEYVSSDEVIIQKAEEMGMYKG